LLRKKKLAKATNYRLYYGYGQEEELARYDLAIVEQAGQTPNSLKKIKESDTLVLAYLSVMEIAVSAPEFQQLKKADFLEDGKEQYINKEYGTYLVDLRSPSWKRLLFRKIENLFSDGYDGLFLDTIGDVEFPDIPSYLRDIQIIAAVQLLQEIRKRFPEHLLLQNNGLEKLCLYTGSILDGICWENPPFARRESQAWVNGIINRLHYLQAGFGLKVLILIEGKQDKKVVCAAQEIALEKGFLFYQAVDGYAG